MSDELTRLAASLAKSQPEKGKTQRDEIVDLVLNQSIELFRSPDEVALASLDDGVKRETFLINGLAFRRRIRELYLKQAGRSAASQALAEAIETLESKAQFDGEVHPAGIRVWDLDGSIYVDLGNEAWEAVRVTPGSWEIISRPPVRSFRPARYGELPAPRRGGSLESFRRFVNCQGDGDFCLLVAWCLSAFRPRHQTPILVLQGEHGAAKSTIAKFIQALVDPGSPPLRSPPKTEQDLIVGARGRRILAFDNLSGIRIWLSDAFCRLSTGGGYGARQLFTDSEEVLFEGIRAIILTSIADLIEHHDLADRSLVLTLPRINEEARRGRKIEEDFERERPLILGALLDALAEGLRKLPSIAPARLPRMADFAHLSIACEGFLGLPPGGFMQAYDANRSEAARQSLESDLVANAIADLMEDRQEWAGTASELLARLNKDNAEARKDRGWPRAPQHLSSRVNRAAPVLRMLGVSVESGKQGRGRSRRRQIWLKNTAGSTDPIDPIGRASGSPVKDGHSRDVAGTIPPDDLWPLPRGFSARGDDGDDGADPDGASRE